MGLRKSSPVSKPITSPEQAEILKEERRERNRLNRQRAKAMERRVAKYLNGDRTPQSGAGSSKGDVTVLFANRPGRFIIECKLTELYRNGEPSITISKNWLTKVQDEARQMKALFGLLVFRYHGRQQDYVLIRASDFHKVVAPELIKINEARIDFNNSKSKTITFGYQRAQLAVTNDGSFVCVTIDHVLYYFMTLVALKERLDSL